MLAYILQGMTLGLSAGFNPGPLLAFYLSRSIQQGWRRTLPAAFAPLISDGPIIALVLVILTQMPGWILVILRFLGGGYILFLAWKSYRGLKGLDIEASIESSPYRSLWDAVVMNLLNPNPYIYWSTLLGPILIQGWRVSPAHGLVFAAGFFGVMIASFIFLIVLFDISRRFGSKVVRALGGVSVLALAGFGLFQIGSGVLELIAF